MFSLLNKSSKFKNKSGTVTYVTFFTLKIAIKILFYKIIERNKKQFVASRSCGVSDMKYIPEHF